MNGSLVIMGDSSLLIFVTPMDGSLAIMGDRLFVFDIFVTPMDGSLVIMEGSLLLRFLFLQWMVVLSLWEILCS